MDAIAKIEEAIQRYVRDERLPSVAAGSVDVNHRKKTSAAADDGPTALQYLAGIMILGASAGA